MAVLFLSAFAVGLSGAMMPGPLLTYTVRRSLSSGPIAGFVIVAGHAVLEFALIAVIFMGFDMVLQSKLSQTIIGIAGGMLLAYMGIRMITESVKNKVSMREGTEKAGSKNMFLSGVFISAANPYFLLWWAIIGLGFIIRSYDSYGFSGVTVYYFGHIAADITWYGLISIIIGLTRKFIGEKPYRIIIAVLGGILVFFSFRFIYEAVISI